MGERVSILKNLKYGIVCLLKGEFEKYHHQMVDEIASHFDLKITKELNIPTHFSIKYLFETEDIKEIEEIIEKFCETHKKTPVKLGGFGNFPFEKVVFIEVKLSEVAKRIFFEFISELRKVKWMIWDKYDAENLYFHSTIAEECDEKFEAVREFVQGKEKYFDYWFDNITILRLEYENQKLVKWEVHKSWLMK
jgi:hypothetical protein